MCVYEWWMRLVVRKYFECFFSSRKKSRSITPQAKTRSSLSSQRLKWTVWHWFYSLFYTISVEIIQSTKEMATETYSKYSVCWSNGRYVMSGPKLSTRIPRASRWPSINRSFLHRFTHKTWHMSESVSHKRTGATRWHNCNDALKSTVSTIPRKDLWSCLTNKTPHRSLLALLNIEANLNLDLWCLHGFVFNWEHRYQLKHQIILLLFDYN